MSKKELMTYEIVEAFRRGEFTRREAAAKLGLSERSITRKARALREQGLTGLKHGNRGKEPANKKTKQERETYLKLYKAKYWDFNFQHALEMIHLLEEPREFVSYSTFRKWCREEGLGKVKRRRTSKARVARERMSQEGMLLQLDGSPHKWNGEDQWSLIALIDDATSTLPFARFFPSETTWACMDVLKETISRYGIPEFILTDQAGWAKQFGKRAHFSQFARACKELGITVIATPIAESKGRIERSFRTTQDRLIPELRLHEIKTMKDANRYLDQVYLPEWNNKFTVAPRSDRTRYKPVPVGVDLDEIFCLKYTRQVNRNHTVHFEGACYKLPEPPKNLWKHEVTIHRYKDDSIKIFYAGEPLQIALMKQPKRRWTYVG